MARDCIRHPRHIVQPVITGRQADLFGSPTVEYEIPRKPVPNRWSSDFLRHRRAIGPNPD